MAKCMNGTAKIGDTVAYPTRHSSSLWMTIGEVVEIKTKEHPWRKGETSTSLVVRRLQTSGYTPTGPDSRLSSVGKLDNVVIIRDSLKEDSGKDYIQDLGGEV